MPFIKPRIEYVDRTKKDEIIPVFACTLHWDAHEAVYEQVFGKAKTNPAGDIEVYWWIKKFGAGFEVHNFAMSDKQLLYQGNEMRSGMLGPKSIHYYGDIAEFQKLLPASAATKLDLLDFTDAELKNIKGSSEAIDIFCQTIIDHFSNARNLCALKEKAKMEQYFKGLTVGRSHTVLSFMMQAVKQAYTALGFYQKTYSGLRFSDFGMNDLIGYINGHKAAFRNRQLNVNIDVLKHMDLVKKEAPVFKKSALPSRLTIPGIKTQTIPQEYLNVIKGALKYWRDNPAIPLFTATGVRSTSIPQDPVIVNEYGFRGDGRSPLVVFYSGGMHPSSLRYFTRDVIGKAKSKVKAQDPARDWYHNLPHFDPWLHQAGEFSDFSVFLSISTMPSVSLNFLEMFSGGNGYIYLIRAVGSVDQIATFTKTMYPEGEISLPGGADWDDIIAIRPVSNSIPAKFCYFNEKNKWRAREKDIQDIAIQKLMTEI